jgi:hypothetical protein
MMLFEILTARVYASNLCTCSQLVRSNVPIDAPMVDAMVVVDEKELRHVVKQRMCQVRRVIRPIHDEAAQGCHLTRPTAQRSVTSNTERQGDTWFNYEQKYESKSRNRSTGMVGTAS